MGNIHNLSVIRQCFSYLSDHDVRFPIADYRVHKLTTMQCAKLIIASQLAHWGSFDQISRALRMSNTLQKDLNLPSISASQISRKLRSIPTENLEPVFLNLMAKVKQTLASTSQKLRIIDSTSVNLPAGLAKWAYVNPKQTHIKLHMRVLVVPNIQAIPESMIPTTGNVSDYETVNQLIEDRETIYVMDRGYVKYAFFDQWLKNEVLFVVRINEKHAVLRVEQEYEVPPNTGIVRDAIVQLGSAYTQTERTLRLIEFLDQEGRRYRVVTSCYSLSSLEVAEIYKQRWMIELFFKWIKQHLRIVKVYSHEPQGVWNQIYLALIAYAIALLIQRESGTRLTHWQVLQTVRCSWDKPFTLIQKELHRKALRSSRGRQKSDRPPKSVHMPTVGIMKPLKIT